MRGRRRRSCDRRCAGGCGPCSPRVRAPGRSACRASRRRGREGRRSHAPRAGRARWRAAGARSPACGNSYRSELSASSPIESTAADSRRAVDRDRLAGREVDDHVGEPDRRGGAGGVGGVMALDRRGDLRADPPAADQHRADQGVVDAELAALAAHALVGRARSRRGRRTRRRRARRSQEPADVVKQGGGRQLLTQA